MIVNLSALAFAATLLSSNALVQAISSSEIPADTPISSLLASANTHLAKGETNDALTYYDVAISRDPQNYLTYFKRGATYLSLGRTAQATKDFDKVLSIKPGFEGALLQRARVRAKNGEWDAAAQDYSAHGKSAEELAQLQEAKGATSLAFAAEKAGNWEECVSQSSIAAITYYGLADSERGMDQLRKCLHGDPDSKSCKKLYRKMKNLEKAFAKVNKSFEKKQYASSLKVLLPVGEDAGLVQDIKDDVKELKESGIIPENAPNTLEGRVVEMVCEAYFEAIPWCDQALTYYEHSLHGLMSQAQRHMEADNFEAAIETLNTAKEHHPSAQQLNQLLHNAQVELKRSKTKDYYKVLGVPRDADELQIKGAYRRMVKAHHPDKAHKLGISKEDAEKKMSQVNEAYEVLSNPELKARFDQGDDPNDHEQQRQNPFQGSPFGGHPFAGHSQGGGQQFKFQFGGGGGGFPFG
ncbi:putative DnaJ like protein subfamily C member 3 [Glarea lozoyensis 74030]|uniref:Putative DnaJ like protein subfamily C member 3 n=1 Tax=Glarea lozoyensis (strain ATCC 74030 / MF5533) TaxID=1104152 RepID=H0EGE8_GLAL7|nr:putative DnaJ like protein subfamily C member 3 [Glarea lozoyensis 74030]